MPLTQASRELAARSGTRQVEVVLRADQVAHAVDRAVLQIWRDLLRLARPVIVPGGLAHAREMAHHTANALPHLIAFYVGERLRKLAEWGRNGSVSNVCRSVPAHALRALAVRRGVVRLTRLREAEGEPEIGLGTIDVLAPFRFGLPLDSPSLSLGSLVAILFPPPTEHQVDQVVYASGWQQRIGQGTHLAGPDRIAGVLAHGLASGQSQQEIARQLQPIVQGVQSSARRVARTEALRVAAAVQRQTDHQLGDLVIGYQIHATLDQNTRPEHAARNGTIYYAHPKAGQLGYDAMPHPPQEADGSTAWNCRCYLSPILSDPGTISEPPESPPGPDHVVYSDWWTDADERRKRIAVGTRRYDLVRDMVRDPEWADFVDVEGHLLSLDALKAETAAQRKARAEAVRQALAANRERKRAVGRLGYEPG